MRTPFSGFFSVMLSGLKGCAAGVTGEETADFTERIGVFGVAGALGPHGGFCDR
jgi:hypothetical protein